MLAGITLDDWQSYELANLHGIRADGKWSEPEYGLLCARQNGKGGVLLAYSLARLFMFPRADGQPKLVVHTAHEVKTAMEAFRRVKSVLRSTPGLMKHVARITDANGDEGVELRNGNRLRYIARSKNSGRGFTMDDLIVDEAQELSRSALDALSYAQSAVPNPQTLFTGTVPSGFDNSEVWESVRDRGRKRDRLLGWSEYSPVGSEDPKLKVMPEDRAAWVASNPALGIRITEGRIEQECAGAAGDPDGFLRERLSVWPNPLPEAERRLSGLDMAAWRDAEVDGGLVDGPVLAVAVARSGEYATVCAASRLDEERIFVEHLRTDRFTRWLPDYVKAMRDELGAGSVVLDAKNAVAVVTDLERVGVKFLSMNLSELAGAHSMFVELVNAGLVAHRGQRELEASLAAATVRKFNSGGETWEASDQSKPVTHALAATWAVWGVKKLETVAPKRAAVVRGYA